jgi:creatinine amidohydrolase
MAENVLMPEMSWTEVEHSLKDRPIALLPVGNTEAHGPHLPIATDTVIAVEMARRTAVKLKGRGLHALIAPPVTFSVSELGTAFPGTVSLPVDTAVALVRDVCASLAKQFRAVALIHINQEPANLEALKRAAEEAKKAGASVCFTDLQKKRWVDRLGAAFSAGDHAGSFETSLMLGGEDAYFGDPTAASVEEGEAHFTTLADILTLSIMEHLGSKA